MSLLSAFAGGASLLLLLVPIGRVTVKYPDESILNLGCADIDKLIFTTNQNDFCDKINYAKVNVTLQSCGLVTRYQVQFRTYKSVRYF